MTTNYIPALAPPPKGIARVLRVVWIVARFALRLCWKAVTLYARFIYWILSSMLTSMALGHASEAEQADYYRKSTSKSKSGLF